MLELLDAAFDTALSWTLQMDTREWGVVGVLILVIGAVCMRGFGSRTNY